MLVMKRPCAKYILFVSLTMFLVWAAPVCWSLVRHRSYTGYYSMEGVTCGCGFPMYDEVREDSIYWYIPLHRERTLKCNITKFPDHWEAARVRDGKVIYHLRMVNSETELYMPAKDTAYTMKRVHNIWIIWYQWLAHTWTD